MLINLRKKCKIFFLFILLFSFLNYKVYKTNFIYKYQIQNKKITNYLSIPKISLYYPLYEINSPKNTLNIGLMIYHYEPLVILGHSGTRPNAYFNDLKKLKEDDTFYLSYYKYEGTYKIKTITKKLKKEPLKLSGEVILVTCDLKKTDEQYVFIAEKML